jgi:heme a synthase
MAIDEQRAVRWLHRLGWLTALIAMLPIAIGAVVTTLGAGMVFPDWPTSDGQGMFAYPWFKSTGDAFWEHGHRLAGMAIGLMSLVIAGVAYLTPVSSQVKWTVTAILAGVVGQGLLGGARVIRDENLLAMLHGEFAAVVYCFIGLLLQQTGRHRDAVPLVTYQPAGRSAIWFGGLTLLLLFVQYVLGGLLRHLGSSLAWLVHPWFAIAVLVSGLVFAWVASRSGWTILAQAAWLAWGLLVAQALLGVVTWAVKYGYPQFGIVASPTSVWPIVIRSAHMVLGLLTIVMTFLATVRAFQAARVCSTPSVETSRTLTTGASGVVGSPA